MPNFAESAFRATPAWAPPAAIWAVWPEVDVTALRTLAEPIALLVRPPDMEVATRELDEFPARFYELFDEPAPARAAGPIFVARPGEVAAARFSGAALAASIAELAEANEQRHDLVLDGDAIEVDGVGTALATRQWLLGARNPGRDARDVGVAVHVALDAEQTIWVDRGIGDSKISDVARFVAPGVLVCMEAAAGDPDRDAIREVIAQLRTARDATGRRLEIFTIPAPHAARGASYCGFFIGATHVLVPQFGVPADDPVLARLTPLFPGRTLVPIRGSGFHASLLGQPR